MTWTIWLEICHLCRVPPGLRTVACAVRPRGWRQYADVLTVSCISGIWEAQSGCVCCRSCIVCLLCWRADAVVSFVVCLQDLEAVADVVFCVVCLRGWMAVAGVVLCRVPRWSRASKSWGQMHMLSLFCRVPPGLGSRIPFSHVSCASGIWERMLMLSHVSSDSGLDSRCWCCLLYHLSLWSERRWRCCDMYLLWRVPLELGSGWSCCLLCRVPPRLEADYGVVSCVVCLWCWEKMLLLSLVSCTAVVSEKMTMLWRVPPGLECERWCYILCRVPWWSDSSCWCCLLCRVPPGFKNSYWSLVSFTSVVWERCWSCVVHLRGWIAVAGINSPMSCASRFWEQLLELSPYLVPRWLVRRCWCCVVYLRDWRANAVVFSRIVYHQELITNAGVVSCAVYVSDLRTDACVVSCAIYVPDLRADAYVSYVVRLRRWRANTDVVSPVSCTSGVEDQMLVLSPVSCTSVVREKMLMLCCVPPGLRSGCLLCRVPPWFENECRCCLLCRIPSGFEKGCRCCLLCRVPPEFENGCRCCLESGCWWCLLMVPLRSWRVNADVVCPCVVCILDWRSDADVVLCVVCVHGEWRAEEMATKLLITLRAFCRWLWKDLYPRETSAVVSLS